MSFRYERDDAKQCVVVTMEGSFNKAEGFDILRRLRLEDVGHYAVLYDLRRMTGQPTIADMRSLRTDEVRATKGLGVQLRSWRLIRPCTMWPAPTRLSASQNSLFVYSVT